VQITRHRASLVLPPPFSALGKWFRCVATGGPGTFGGGRRSVLGWPSMLLRLAFSPDSDDLFMFWPVLNGRIDTRGYRFEHVRADTESLNQRATRGDLDVVAISIAAYPAVAKDYLLLPHGGSVGRGYGPVVVARDSTPLEALAGKVIAVPGPGTTAYLVLRLLLPDFKPAFIPIEPYDRVFEALRTGEVDAALLIHEGRLTYEREGFARVIDIGEGWSTLTGGLPLPLGGNAIRRGLGATTIAEVSDLLREGIRYSLAHRDELIDELLRAETRRKVGLERAMLDRYLAMYANADTLGYPDDARRAVGELFDRARQAGLLPASGDVEWAP
jgi:1,4-dihydroxy-6-naphthoate synthase